LNAQPPIAELIAFDGAVECRLESGAINLMLSGFERRGPAAVRTAASALFAGAAVTGPANLGALPPRLQAVRIVELAGAPGARRFVIRAQQLQLDLVARSMQLHRDAGRAFFLAVPPPRVPLMRRLGWSVLLLALRLPGAGRLLARLRSSR
jgi:hypothetical protein